MRVWRAVRNCHQVKCGYNRHPPLTNYIIKVYLGRYIFGGYKTHAVISEYGQTTVALLSFVSEVIVTRTRALSLVISTCPLNPFVTIDQLISEFHIMSACKLGYYQSCFNLHQIICSNGLPTMILIQYQEEGLELYWSHHLLRILPVRWPRLNLLN